MFLDKALIDFLLAFFLRRPESCQKIILLKSFHKV